jgi:hypothetical protein
MSDFSILVIKIEPQRGCHGWGHKISLKGGIVPGQTVFVKAGDEDWTHDPGLTKTVLYHLSYASEPLVNKGIGTTWRGGTGEDVSPDLLNFWMSIILINDGVFVLLNFFVFHKSLNLGE